MTGPRVTIVVVNWRLPEETMGCLRSLERSSIPCRVIVVDNGSMDGSAERIARHFPGVELLALPENVGFGAACNRAITRLLAETNGEFVLLLNNDAVIHPHAIAELLNAAERHPEAGIFGAKIYDQGNPCRIWYAGARRRRGVLAAAGTGRGQIDRGQFAAEREVDYVFGAAMFIRREVFNRIGLFDEEFFLYLEDMDFCLRAQHAGFSLRFVAQAHVWHRGGASTARQENLRKYYFVKSTVAFLRKHTAWGEWVPVLGFWFLVFLRAVITDLAHGNVPAVRSYGAGLINGLTGKVFEAEHREWPESRAL